MAAVVAGVAGVVCGNAVTASPFCRDLLGRWTGCGRLIALADCVGIYARDVDRQVEQHKMRGQEFADRDRARAELVAEAALCSRARHETIPAEAIDREYGLLRAEVGDEPHWREALRNNRLPAFVLRRAVAANLRAREWIERRVTAAISVSENECRAFYTENPQAFIQPKRFRASHLFLAAPAGTPVDITEEKRRTMEELRKQIAAGENFSDLVAQGSEDEATKKRGGDLNYFSDWRMPPEFMATVRALPVGAVSGVAQSRLGFHIVQLTEVKEAHPLSYEEARPEIVLHLENARRRVATTQVMTDLAQPAKLIEN